MPRLPLPSVVRRSGCSTPNPSIVTVSGPSEATIVPLALIGKSEPETATLVAKLWMTMPGRCTTSGHVALRPTPPSK